MVNGVVSAFIARGVRIDPAEEIDDQITETGLLVALLCFLACSLPRSSSAQSSSGSWTGTESFQVYEFTGSGYTEIASGSGIAATFSYSYDGTTLSMAIEGGFDSFASGPSSDGYSLYVVDGDSGVIANFFADGPSAVADIYIGTAEGFSDTSFLAVPEPSSLVQAGTAIVMIVVAAWIRSARPRSAPRLGGSVG